MKTVQICISSKIWGGYENRDRDGGWVCSPSQGSGSKRLPLALIQLLTQINTKRLYQLHQVRLRLYLQYATRRRALQQWTTETCKLVQIGFKANYIRGNPSLVHLNYKPEMQKPAD